MVEEIFIGVVVSLITLFITHAGKLIINDLVNDKPIDDIGCLTIMIPGLGFLMYFGLAFFTEISQLWSAVIAVIFAPIAGLLIHFFD